MPPVKRPRWGTGYIKTGPDSPGDMSLEEKINAAPVGQVVEFNLRVREDSDDAGSQQDQPDEGKSNACLRPQLQVLPPRWKTGVFQRARRCAGCEAFICWLQGLANEATTLESARLAGCGCPELRLRWKTGDIQTCRRCFEEEVFICWLHAVESYATRVYCPNCW